MNTDSLELIFEKLGTTMENIIPATIEYGKYRCTIDISIFGTMFAVGIILIIIGAVYAYKDSTDYEHDYEGICMACFGFGICLALFGFCLSLSTLIDMRVWNSNHATIKAYQTILGWIKG